MPGSMRKTALPLFALLIPLLCTQARASEIIRVPDDQPTLQDAVTAAAPGDTIRMAAGVYTLAAPVYIEKDLALLGDGVDATILESPGVNCLYARTAPGGARPTVLVEQLTVRLSRNGILAVDTDLTIRNCRTTGCTYRGAYAVRCSVTASHLRSDSNTYMGVWLDTCSATLSDCEFADNTGGWNGGGVCSVNGNIAISNSTFTNNTCVYRGGGVFASAGILSLNNCTFTGNSAAFDGGGACIWEGGLIASGCTFSGNTTPGCGGGLQSHYATTEASDCTFTGNQAVDAGGAVDQYDSDCSYVECRMTGNWSAGVGGASSGFGSLHMAGCTVQGNAGSWRGGGVNVYAGPVTLLDCTITGNTCDGVGGGLFAEDSVAQIEKTTISGNTCTDAGGGIRFEREEASLTDCTLSGNTGSFAGGGIWAGWGGSLMLTRCAVSGNATDGWGGGVNSYQVPIRITDCQIVGNSAGGNGGGVTISETTAELTGCGMLGNSTPTAGGGLCLQVSEVSLTGCDIDDNSAGWGGGLTTYLCNMTMANSRIRRNRSVGAGGGMSLYADHTFTACEVSDNVAGDGGGGIVFWSEPQFRSTMNGCTVAGNRAATIGGGIYSSGHNLGLLDCTISRNSADQVGGGIEALFGQLDMDGCAVVDNTSAANVGGMYVWGCTTSLRQSTFRHNVSPGYGAVCLFTADTSGTATDCDFSDNSGGTYGGGLFCYGSNVIDRCRMTDNRSGLSGAGLLIWGCDGAASTVTNCAIAGNVSGERGAVWVNGSQGDRLVNNTIVSNIGADGAGGILTTDSNPIIANTVISQSGSAISSTGELQPIRRGNCLWGGGYWVQDDGGQWYPVATDSTDVTADPRLSNPTAGDFHLLTGSPCVDRGASSDVPLGVVTDLYGAARIAGRSVDIGAAEHSVGAADLEWLIEDVGMMFRSHQIDNKGMANSCTTKLRQALAAYAAGDMAGTREALGAFLNHVVAQRGKHITARAADELTAIANWFLANM